MNTRLTLVARDWSRGGNGWNYTPRRDGRMVFLESVPVLSFVLGSSGDMDVERIIIDRAGNADQLLDLLASLPHDFRGDVLCIRAHGGGILSATGRGGDRVLYSLREDDVRFYLETHELVSARVELERTA